MARHRPISTLHDRNSLKRRVGQKSPRSITLIICEGETEEDYFKAARIHYELSTAEVIVAENTFGSAPISVVQCAERGGYDQVFCVFDRNGHESFERARKRIQELASRKRNPLPIQEAISIPCFELWVLLHFEKTDAPFESCTEVIQRLREGDMQGYEKANTAIAKQLMKRVNTAIKNAEWLEARAANNRVVATLKINHLAR